MRTRSSSIYTKRPNVEPPQVTGRCSLPDTLPDFPDVDLSPPTLKKASSATDVSTMFDDFGPLVDKRIKEDFSGDFAKENRSSIEAKNPRYSIDDFLSSSNFSTTNSTCSSVSNLSNLSNVSNVSSTSCRICPVTFSTVIFDDYFGLKTMEKPQKMFKGMMIGTQSAGKRSLLQAMFPEHKVTIPIAKQPFDLMTKTIEKSKIINRYHFWLKEPNMKEKRLAPLINMYYKNCSVFFLVYNPDVKSSFEELEAELKLIHQVHSQKELFLILIGNRRGSKQPHKVTAADITSLKEKYDIKFSLVLDVAKGVPADLRNFADSFLR